MRGALAGPTALTMADESQPVERTRITLELKTFVAGILIVLTAVGGLYWRAADVSTMTEGFRRTDERLYKVDERVTKVEDRLRGVENKLTEVAATFTRQISAESAARTQERAADLKKVEADMKKVEIALQDEQQKRKELELKVALARKVSDRQAKLAPAWALEARLLSLLPPGTKTLAGIVIYVSPGESRVPPFITVEDHNGRSETVFVESDTVLKSFCGTIEEPTKLTDLKRDNVVLAAYTEQKGQKIAKAVAKAGCA